MNDRTKKHRRNRAWHLAHISRLNACYWKKVQTQRQRVSVGLNSGVLLLVFLIAVSPSILAIKWNPALLTASMTFVAALLVAFPVKSRMNRAKDYSKQWSELRHDSELLWDEGDHRGWGREHAGEELARLDARMREYQAAEREQQNTRIVVECERELYEQRRVPFPPLGVQAND